MEFGRDIVVDSVAIVSPTILCLAIFFLDDAVKEQLVLRGGVIDPVSFYLSNFVHFEWGHMASNFFLYFVTVVPAYLLYKSIESRAEFRLALLISIILSSTLVSWSFITFANPGLRGFGFSGVAFSIFGLVFYSLAQLLTGRSFINSFPIYLLIIMIGPMTKIDIIKWPPREILNILIGFIVIFYVYYFLRIYFRHGLHRNKYLSKAFPRSASILMLVLLFIYFMYINFFVVDLEITRIDGNIVINNVAHLMGVVAGYISPVLADLANRLYRRSGNRYVNY